MTGVTENQLLRWAIPGWSMLLMFVVLKLEDGLLRGNLADLAAIFGLGGQNSIVGIFVGTVAGVPLGYLIYQVYFWFRWNWPGSRLGILFQRSKGQGWSATVLRWFSSPGRLDEIECFIAFHASSPSRPGALSARHVTAKYPWLADVVASAADDHRRLWAVVENIMTDAALAMACERRRKNGPDVGIKVGQ